VIQKWQLIATVNGAIDEMCITPAVSYELSYQFLLIDILTQFTGHCFCGNLLQVFFTHHRFLCKQFNRTYLSVYFGPPYTDQ